MTNPQQPELGRSGKGATTEGSAKSKVSDRPRSSGPTGPVPEDNLPGHHPEVEQDKPTGPPPVPPLDEGAGDGDGGGRNGGGGGRNGRGDGRNGDRQGGGRRDGGAAAEARGQDATAPTAAPARPVAGKGVRVRFPFAFDRHVGPAAALFGATPFTAWVDVDGEALTVRFGPWSLRTPLDNVAGVHQTGPYSWWKVAGPPRLSLVDRGVTFATSTRGGVCIEFRRPVPGALPFGVLRHPSATVTVDDPDALVEALTSAREG